jgi:pilus assembly protein CpaB
MFLAVGGLVAAYVAKNLLATDEMPQEVEISTIPMALADIEPGTMLTEAHVGNGRIPADKIEPDMILNERVVIGRVAKQAIKAGSAFRPDLLYPPGVRPPLDVADGMRAVTVDVQETSDLVDGLVSSGQYVDVHLTANLDGDARMGGGLTMLLFRGVRVLAINGGSGLSRAANSATLELTPKQANVMILAQGKGKITMTYNPEGKGTGVVDVPEEHRATLEQILGLKPLPEPLRPFVSEHYGASNRRVIQWRDGERVESAFGTSDYGAGEPRVETGGGDVSGSGGRGDGQRSGGSVNPDGPSARSNTNHAARG